MPLDAEDRARLQDMVNFGAKVAAIVAGMSREAFITDHKTFFAACYGIQVIGEAAWKCSDGFKKSHPTVPWPLISGMRHRLVHDYGRTDESIVFQVASLHLPKLIAQVQEILANSDRSP